MVGAGVPAGEFVPADANEIMPGELTMLVATDSVAGSPPVLREIWHKAAML